MSEYDEGLLDGAAREKIREHDRRLNAVNGHIKDMTKAVHAVEVTLSVLTGKLKVYGVMAMILVGVVSPIVTGLIVHYVTKRL